MRVVFVEMVPGSGRVGEVKEVADGYARHYLLPRKMALPATASNVQQAEAKAQVETRRQARHDAAAGELAAQLEGKSITIAVRVGEQGRLYGSITSLDIAQEASKLASREIEHQQILLAEPIRELGEYQVVIRFTRNVEATLSVVVAPVEQD